MSICSELLDTGFDVLIDLHGTAATHTPTSGAAGEVKLLDNGSPSELLALYADVEGVSRIVTVPRTTTRTYTRGDSLTIGSATYYILSVRHYNERATDLILGATALAGKQ